MFRLISLLSLLFLAGSSLLAQPVFINEYHYDNVGTDAGEGIEVAGPAGTPLNCFQILLYNGANGQVYNTLTLSGTIPDLCNGFGSVFFTASLQNAQTSGVGSGDGFALVFDSTACLGFGGDSVIQFLSYEGTFTATNGAAAGMTSTALTVDEATPVPVGSSIQLTGNGTDFTDFTWTTDTSSYNAINPNQTFNGACGAITASQFTFTSTPTGCLLTTTNFPVSVCATNGGGAIDGSYSGFVSLSVVSGPGNLVGTNIAPLIGGCANFTNLSFDTPGTYVLNATDGSFSNNSLNIYVNTHCTTCPSLTGSVIDACGTNEGRNEILFFNSGDYAIPLSFPEFNLTYGQTSPPSTTYSNGFTSNATYINTLNTNAGCVIFIDAATVEIIPPNSSFMLMRSNPDFAYNYSNWCGQTIYVAFVTDANWVEIGNFKNCVDCGVSQNGTLPRFFRTDFTGLTNAPSCQFDYSYTPCTDLVCPGGGTGNSSGDGVQWPYGGGPIDTAWNQCTPDLITLLPVEYELPLQGYREDDRVRLNWSTATEVQSSHFVVERKDEWSNEFQAIGEQNAMGNSDAATYYSFFDHLPPDGTLYYRLRQVDLNGDVTFSQVLALRPHAGAQAPQVRHLADQHLLEIGFTGATYAQVRLLDLNGRVLQASPRLDASQQPQIELSTAGFASGLYLYEIVTDAARYAGKFMVQ